MKRNSIPVLLALAVVLSSIAAWSGGGGMPAHLKWVKGVVEVVDGGKNMLVINFTQSAVPSLKGKKSLPMTSDTTFRKNNKDAALANLKKGDRVEILYDIELNVALSVQWTGR